MLKGLLESEVDAELIATFIFIMISGIYITHVYGITKVFDTLFLWMFPASIIVFLTLLIVKLIERGHRLRQGTRKYVEFKIKR